MKILLIIDCQKNFVNKYTKRYIKKIETLVSINKYNEVVFTKFCNYKNSKFYEELNYVGCIKEEDKTIVIDTGNHKIIEKSYYSACTDEFNKYISKIENPEIYLCGFDTDACVLKTALDLFEKNIKVKVLKDDCMSHAGYKAHNSAIKILKRLIGVKNII